MAVLALLPPPADSTQAKVCYFETTLGADQKICRLQIPDWFSDHLVLACVYLCITSRWWRKAIPRRSINM